MRAGAASQCLQSSYRSPVQAVRSNPVTAMHPSDRHYRSQTVRLADLTVVTDVIESVTFENCIIEGPAVVVMLGNGTVSDSSFEGDLDSTIWVVPRERQHVLGAVAMVNCNIIGCQLRRIGIAVPEDDVEMFRRALGGSD